MNKKIILEKFIISKYVIFMLLVMLITGIFLIYLTTSSCIITPFGDIESNCGDAIIKGLLGLFLSIIGLILVCISIILLLIIYFMRKKEDK